MKKLLCFMGILLPLIAGAQNFTSIATDQQGDDQGNNPDAAQLHYALSTNEDSLYLKLEHHNMRAADFGYSIAIDTNLNPADGAAPNQANLASGSPNNSMNYDLILYIYQNGVFPGINISTHDAQQNVWIVSMSLDTADPKSIVIGIPISDLGGQKEFNLLAFTGSFDITPGGAGPGDVMPNSGYAEIRQSGMAINEYSKTLSVYPNPAEDHFFIGEPGSFEVYDLRGRKIRQVENRPGKTINCNDLSPGFYLLKEVNGQSTARIQIK